jgi:hypothetical protein
MSQKSRTIILTSHDLDYVIKNAEALTKETGIQHYADSYDLTDVQLRQSNPHTIHRHFVYKFV